MTTNLPALPENTTLARLQRALTPEERVALGNAVMEKVTDPRFKKPVPRFLSELPWGGNNDEITDRIAAGILVAENPDSLQDDSGTIPTKDLIGKSLTVYQIAVLDGDKEGGWGPYLLLDITIGENPERQLGNTSSKQIITRLARAWVEGEFPLKGTVAQITTGSGGGNTPLAFITAAKPVEVEGEEPF